MANKNNLKITVKYYEGKGRYFNILIYAIIGFFLIISMYNSYRIPDYFSLIVQAIFLIIILVVIFFVLKRKQDEVAITGYSYTVEDISPKVKQTSTPEIPTEVKSDEHTK